MKLQLLASGSKGNATLVRAGELNLLVDAGLSAREMHARLEQARVGPQSIQHLVVTHGHLDHARSAGIIAKRHASTLHCAERMMSYPALCRAKRFSTLSPGVARELWPTDDARGRSSQAALLLTAVALPHDADPTVAVRLEFEGRVAVVLTDMGVPQQSVARQLAGAHVLVLEFNHDSDMLEAGPYSLALKRRISGGRGHLSNPQAAQMLRWLASDKLHTLVLAHLSETNNTCELALAEARATLDSLGATQVALRVASQHSLGEPIEV